MRPRLKVCGVTDPRFAAEAVRSGVDYIGVIFAAASPRKVDVPKARQIAAAARAAGGERTPKVVGVFTSGAAAEIADAAAAVPLDVVQLHGAFGDEAVAALKGEGYEVWRLWAGTHGAEDAVLLDGRDGGRVGGTGRLADWALAGELGKRGLRVVLAGGLSAANAAEAASTGADVLDFNSSLETSPGVKSMAKLDELMYRIGLWDGRMLSDYPLEARI